MMAHLALLLVLGLGAAWLAGVTACIPSQQRRPQDPSVGSDGESKRGDHMPPLPREILDVVAEVESRSSAQLLRGIPGAVGE
jgi:hypothetical protein